MMAPMGMMPGMMVDESLSNLQLSQHTRLPMTPQELRMQHLASASALARHAGDPAQHQQRLSDFNYPPHPLQPGMQPGIFPHVSPGEGAYYMPRHQGFPTGVPHPSFNSPQGQADSALEAKIAAAASHKATHGWDGGDGFRAPLRAPDGSLLAPHVGTGVSPAGKEAMPPANARPRSGRQGETRASSNQLRTADGGEKDGRPSEVTRAPAAGRGQRSGAPRSSNPKMELPRYRAGPRNAPDRTPPAADGVQVPAQVASTPRTAAGASHTSPPAAGVPKSSPAGKPIAANGATRGREKEVDAPRQRQPVVSRSRMKAAGGAP